MTEPEKLGRYEIVRELGRGGMGIVLLGRDPMIDRLVALKIIKLSADEDITQSNKELLTRFFIEAKAVGKLAHPNIVTIFDVGEEDGKSYMALEYIDGSDLAVVIKEDGAIPLERAVDITIQVASGLGFAHNNGIIHRDIKPGNILLQKDDQVKIADFGLARLQASHSVTQTGHAVGSPSYMSPEQVQGIHLDGRSDIFSLGIMFYELITGRRPFVGESMSTLIFKIIQDTPPPPSGVLSTIPSKVDPFIKRILAKNPDERYQTCDEVITALKGLVSGGKVVIDSSQGFGVGDNDRTVDFDSAALIAKEKRRKMTMAFAALATLGVIAGAGWFFLGGGSDQKKPSVAIAPKPAAVQKAETKIVALSKTVAIKPTQTSEPAPAPAPQPAPEPASVVKEAPPLPPTLVVTSLPSGATVKVDDVVLGKTPVTLARLSPGNRSVTLSYEGFASESKNIGLVAGEESKLAFTLTPTGGTIKIDGPKGAVVYLDGKKIGATPLTHKAAPGSYKLTVRKKGYHSYSVKVTVDADKTTSKTAKLVKLGVGEVHVIAIPWAEIYLDGKKQGSTPKVIKGVTEGKVKVRLVNPAYRPYVTTVTVKTGGMVDVRHTFTSREELAGATGGKDKEAKSGSLAIDSYPPGTVFIDGKHYGKTPVEISDLSAGSHKLLIKREGSPDYKRTVTVVADTVIRLDIK